MTDYEEVIERVEKDIQEAKVNISYSEFKKMMEDLTEKEILIRRYKEKFFVLNKINISEDEEILDLEKRYNVMLLSKREVKKGDIDSSYWYKVKYEGIKEKSIIEECFEVVRIKDDWYLNSEKAKLMTEKKNFEVFRKEEKIFLIIRY
ncbi:hypothetical protein EHZ13_15070 [Clostridium perfringens]|uniref:hypothetical protein n=1 Tax=Clostridium perfringens TaxID=1502 RepID=UPI000F5231D9|nr:hypothetical protein [Clostridium perfringens]MDK3122642.1 hypothetical protein [Clostridium perfringens]RQN11237.1 hypothetical protein EHZ13_15070 [Clostridium perfringens]UBK39478.1 hypothetical protein KLF44_16175 [Clostridium perfringens]